MNEEFEILKLVAKQLGENDIPYMLTGSVALNFYATPRMTRDIDFVLEISEGDTSNIVALFNADFYIEKQMIIEAIKNQGIFNIIHNEYIIKIDFIIRKKSPYRKVEFTRRKLVNIGDLSIWIVSPEDLIISKLWWAKDSHSDLQFSDVKDILNQNKNIDNNYLQKWLYELNLSELYKEITIE